MNLYCTLFDRNYVARGLALHASLLRHRKEFRLVVLCLDETVFDILTTLALQNTELVSLSSLGESDPELLRTRPQRTAVEYYFTCKPALMKFIAEKHVDAQRITYLDSDLFYFSDPKPLELEYSGSSVALTPHRFPTRLAGRNQYGRFNAGWVSVSCGEEGRRFIDWWRARCIEWCRLEVQQERFGDQKYLDRVPELFPKCHVMDSPGSNVAPWNVSGRELTVSEGALLIDGSPLIYYHFHGVRRVWWRFYDSGLLAYGAPLTPVLRDHLYLPYLRAVARLQKKASQVCTRVREGPKERQGISDLSSPSDVRRAIWSLLRSRTGVFLY